MNRLGMRKKSGLSVCGLLLFAVILHFAATPAYSSEEIARLTDFSGTVIVQSRGDWGVKPEKGLPLYSMDRVVTRTGTAVVSFKDGAVIEIRANSNLLIEEQEKSGSVIRNLRLLLGKMLFRSGQGSSARTNLQTPTAVCGLRGTAGTLSIGLDGATYIQFTEGGTSYTVGDFLSGVAKDVPQELADLNPAQRAAFLASAAADQAKKAQAALKEGKISDPQAALAAAKAAEAAALAAKTAAEAMLNNPDPDIRAQAQAALDAANKALEEARAAAKRAIDAGATPEGPLTYTDPEKKPLFDVPPQPLETVVTIITTTTTTTSSSPSSSSSSISNPTPTTTIAPLSGRMDPEAGFLNGGGTLSGNVPNGTLEVTGVIKSTANQPYHGPVGGETDGGGVFQGFLSGAKGSFQGIFDSIFVTKEGDAGFLHSNLSGAIDANSNLSATGDLTKTGTYGNIHFATGQTLSSLMNDESTDANLYLNEVRLPRLSEIEVNESGRAAFFGGATWDRACGGIADVKGVELDNGTLLGVWSHGLGSEDLYYSNHSSPARTWTGAFGYEDWTEQTGRQFILGDLLGEEDGAGHLKVWSDHPLYYMDEHYMGKMTFNFEGYYGEGANAVASGTLKLDPLAWSGQTEGMIMGRRSGAYMDGIVGGLSPLAELERGKSTEFLAMGGVYEGVVEGISLLLSTIRSKGEHGDKGLFGYAAGIVKDGISRSEIDGAMVAIFDVGDNVGLLTSYNPDDISSIPFVKRHLPEGDPGSVQGGASGTLYRFEESSGMWEMSGSLHNDPNPFLGDTVYDTDTIRRGTKSFYAMPIEGSSFNLTVLGGSFEKTYFKVNEGEDRGKFGVYDLMVVGSGERFRGDSDLWFTGIKIVNDRERTVAKALMFGSFDGDEMRGVLFGLKQSYDEEGDLTYDMILKGPVYGLFDMSEGEDRDMWVGESVGTWKNHVLRTEGGSLFYDSAGSILKWANDPGLVDLTINEYGKRSFLAVGEYFESVPGTYNGPVIQSTRMSGDLLGTGTESYEGIMSGTWKDGFIDGMAAAIYLSSDGGAGILIGDLAGLYAGTGSGEGMWVTEGLLDAVQIGTGFTLSPEQFHSSIITETSNKTPSIRGRFLTDSDVEYGKIKLTDRSWKSLSIDGQDWGISSVKYAGTYEGTPSDRWKWETDFSEKGIKKFETVTGSKWSEGVLSGQQSGAWVNWDKAVTGVMGGQLKGTFNPADTTWQAVSSVAYLETRQFMNMIANGQTDALQKLNIPCIEVGKTTMAGSSTLLNVKMNDVTFFAYSTGASPRIWATNNITGTYNGAPAVGHNVNLQSISGGNLNATFSVNNWANSNWGANVAGSGVLNRTDVRGTNVNVSFQGAAAGNYANGILAGTGSGTAK